MPSLSVTKSVHAPSSAASGRWHAFLDANSGELIDDLVFEPDQHKTLYKVDAPRYTVVPPTARVWLERADPRRANLGSYS